MLFATPPNPEWLCGDKSQFQWAAQQMMEK